MNRRIFGRGLALAAASLLALAAGCQVIVPDDLPDYTCSSADPSACPAGTSCDLRTRRCVASSAVTLDSGVDARMPVDSLPDADRGPLPVGAACRVDGDCKTNICGTSTILTTAVVPSNTIPICTQTCCTSAECPSGFVCFAGGTGGTYCVPADKAQRSPPQSGGAEPGQTCTANADCRSGLCDIDESGRCLDTCCNDAECALGTLCRVRSIAGHLGWACGAPNRLDGGPAKSEGPDASCGASSDCANDNCVVGVFPSKRCTPSCCSADSCAAQGFSGNTCAMGLAGNDQLRWCFAPFGGTKAVGEACTNNSDCISKYCDAERGNTCVSMCCTDADCPMAQHCRPSPVGTPYLRCVP